MSSSSTIPIILVTLIAIYYALTRPPPPLTTERFEANKQLLQVSSQEVRLALLSTCNTAYYESGPQDGELVVLVHGMTVPYKFSFRYAAKKLAERGFRVLSYDLCGRGLSGPAGNGHTGQLYVTQLASLLMHTHLSERQFHLVGSSMGGAISVLFTDEFPDRVRSLQLIAPAGHTVAMPLPAYAVRLPLIGELLYEVIGKYVMTNSFYRDCHAPQHPETNSICDAIVTDISIQCDNFPHFRTSLLHTIREFPMGGCGDAYARIGQHTRPVQLLWGEDDTLIPFKSTSDALLKVMPQATLKSWPGYGHGLLIQAHDQVVPTVIQFIEKHKSKTTKE